MMFGIVWGILLCCLVAAWCPAAQ